MSSFIINILIKVLTDPKVQQTIKNLLGQLITERIVPLVPLAVASATKAISDLIPDLPDIALGHVADTVRDDLNKAIPDFDFGIPALDSLLDWWRPKP